MDIGFQPAALLLVEAQGVVGADAHEIVNLRAKRDGAPLALPRHRHLDRLERRILDRDPDLLDRRLRK